MLKVGVAGIKRGNGFVKIFNHNPETKVVAVCDIREDLKGYAEANGIKSWYADFDRFIVHDFDIAVIATPFPLHVSQSIDALKAGKYVLSEVPPAYSVEEAKKLLEAVKKAGLYKYMMAANVNYFPFIKNWIKMTDEGKLGRIFYAEAEYVHPLKEIITNPDGTPTWRATLPPIYYCTHSLGPLISMMKERFVSVVGFSTGSNVAPKFGTIDMEVALLKSEGGAIVKLLCGFSVLRGAQHHYYSIYGTKGCIEKGRFNWEDAYVYFKDDPQTKELTKIKISILDPDAPPEARVGGHGTAEYHLVQDFIKSILNDTKPPIDIYTALDFGLPGLYAHQSALQNGKAVEIPDPRRW